MLSIDPEQTIVILVGSSEYPDDPDSLPELPSVRNNIEDLSHLLKDPTVVGVPEKNILVIQDQPNASGVATKIALKAKDATDTLIFYYAGHGVIGRDTSELHLAVRDTTDIAVDYNAIPITQVKKAIYNSPAKRKIMILDCCYSGRALEIMSSADSLVRENIDLKGTFAIASAPADKPASAPKNEKYTAFTGELLRLMEQGIDNGKEGITLDEIYERIRLELKRRPNVPAPQRANFQDADKLVICRNRKMILSNLESSLASLQELLTLKLDEQNKKIETFIREQNDRLEELELAVSGRQPISNNSSSDDLPTLTHLARRTLPRTSAIALSAAIVFVYPFSKSDPEIFILGGVIVAAIILTHLMLLIFTLGKEGSWSSRFLRLFFGTSPYDDIIRKTLYSLGLTIAAMIYKFIQYSQR